MLKKAFLVIAVIAAGSMGSVSAQDATPVAAKHIAAGKLTHMRIFYLKDRIQNQRERIDAGLTAGTLTAAQAEACRVLLDAAENSMKADHTAYPNKLMTKDTYENYNAQLDRNSVLIKEEKRYFYYYGPYADQSPNYAYYYDVYPVAVAPTAAFSGLEKSNPGMFELKDRVAGQRTRIQMDITANTLTGGQAKNCDAVLDSAESQIKTDFTANGRHRLTKDQYVSLNTTLDANAAFIQENRQYYYYYNNAE